MYSSKDKIYKYVMCSYKSRKDISWSKTIHERWCSLSCSTQKFSMKKQTLHSLASISKNGQTAYQVVGCLFYWMFEQGKK